MDFTDVTGEAGKGLLEPFCGLKSHMFQPEACEFVCGVSLCPA